MHGRVGNFLQLPLYTMAMYFILREFTIKSSEFLEYLNNYFRESIEDSLQKGGKLSKHNNFAMLTALLFIRCFQCALLTVFEVNFRNSIHAFQ
ncbi:hypothetical protein ACV242_001204 [Peribacillus simplex]